MVPHTCVVCRTFFALPELALCGACHAAKEVFRAKVTEQIKKFEDAFLSPFERSDEVWVKISETESACVMLTDPTDSPSAVSVFRAAEKSANDDTITLGDDEYEVVSDRFDVMMPPASGEEAAYANLVRDLTTESDAPPSGGFLCNELDEIAKAETVTMPVPYSRQA